MNAFHFHINPFSEKMFCITYCEKWKSPMFGSVFTMLSKILYKKLHLKTEAFIVLLYYSFFRI